jgi:hypothetical protein
LSEQGFCEKTLNISRNLVWTPSFRGHINVVTMWSSEMCVTLVLLFVRFLNYAL